MVLDGRWATDGISVDIQFVFPCTGSLPLRPDSLQCLDPEGGGDPVTMASGKERQAGSGARPTAPDSCLSNRTGGMVAANERPRRKGAGDIPHLRRIVE
jgi:hypothetical protein